MKRKLLFGLLFVIMTISYSICLTACEKDDSNEHKLTHVTAVNATCTENGNIEYWYCSDCEKYFSDSEANTEVNQKDTVIASKGHIYGDWSTVKSATCTEKGEHSKECSVCHHIEVEAITATGHSFGDWLPEGAEHVRTCNVCKEKQREAHKLEYGTCTACGAQFDFEYDGVIVSLDWYNASNQTYYIRDLFDFNGIAFLVNNNLDSFENKTILLGNDIDFGIGNYLPIGTMAFVNYEDTDYAFRGVLSGNGYKILNYNIKDKNIHTVFYPYSKAPLYITSLFLKNYGRIEDIIIENFTIDTSITEDFSDLQNMFRFSVLTVENHGEIIDCTLTGKLNCFVQADQPFSDVSVLFNYNYGYISNCYVDCSAEITRNSSCVSYSQFGSFNYGRIENSTACGNIYYTNADSVHAGSYSGFVFESDYSTADNIYYNPYDNWISIYGEQGLYSCESSTNIYSSSFNLDKVCGIAVSSTSAISSCKYSGTIDISANSDTVLIDGKICGIVGEINNSHYSKSIISNCVMTGNINLVVNQINDDGYLRILSIAGIIGEIMAAREQTIIKNNEFSGLIKVTDNTKGDLIGDNAGYHIAGIVGTAMLHRTRENPTTETLIENCHMNGAIEVKTSHSSLIGGIAAYMYRINELEGFAGDDFILNVSSCSFNGNITVKDCGPAMIGLGGIAGQMLSVNANECNAKGEFYIYNSGGAFFGTIAGESASSLYFENSYIIDCEGDVQAIIDGVTYNCSNLFCYSSYSYIKNEKIATELTNKYYYNTLDVNGKALYEEIYTWLVEIGRYPYTLFAANHISAMIDYGKYNLSVEDCNEIFVMVKFDNPSFFYIENKFYTLDNNGESVHYAELKIWDRYLTQEISTDQENLQSILNSVADKTSSLSEYNKIKYIYDFIKENTVYAQYDEYTSTVVGTLLNGTAVCEGYSLTFKYLCDYMGINCIVVASDEMDHAWNIVEVEGKWYYVDTTWSDTGAKDYFLLGSDEFCSDHYTFNDYLKIPEVSTKNYN